MVEKNHIFKANLLSENRITDEEKQKIIFFITESGKIPYNNLTDEQLLAIMYNYDINKEYIDDIFRILKIINQ